MTQILEGKTLAQNIKDKIQEDLTKFTSLGNRKPTLALMIVGNDPASETYVKSKANSCTEIGFESVVLRMDADVSEAAVLKQVRTWNNDTSVDGILVQLPLPKHINENKVIEAIDPDKDVDGFHPISAGRLMIGLDGFIPCTPFGILKLIEHYKIETSGKHVVVVGRSNIVGKPIANLLYQKNIANSTVTICHTGTKDLKHFTLQADIIIAAMGSPMKLTADYFNPNAVIIDVGINRIVDSSKKSGFRLVGDVDFESVQGKVAAVTPVPGGVGPLTIAMLMQNSFISYKKRLGL